MKIHMASITTKSNNMTPEQFEHYVANIFTEQGYKTNVSPLSNDWGIDVIATKDDDKIGIQAKMYGGSSRKVNRRMIMELYGAAAFQECTSAVLATDGEVLSDAKEVAEKLGIDILWIPNFGQGPEITSNNKSNHEIPSRDHDKIVGYPSFDEVWEEYIMPLKGKEIENGTLVNTIISVTWAGVSRRTSTGRTGKIDIEGFKLAYDELRKKGEITRGYINQQFDKRCSSGIVLILSQIPFIEATFNPNGLKLNKF